MRKKYQMPTLNEAQTDRLEEIKFYLFTARMNKVFKNTVGRFNFSDFLNMMADLTETDALQIEQAYLLVNKEKAKPTQNDIIILTKYQNLPYRFVDKNFASFRKIYSVLDEFISTYSTDSLEPRLEKETRILIKTFNNNFEKIYPAFFVLGETIKNEDEPAYNWGE